MVIIPAIDIIDGKCVRLTQGDYSRKKVYSQDPLDVAKMFENAGLQRLHLVDLDGAKAGSVQNWKVLENIAANTSLVIDFGGGVKTNKDVQVILGSGAALVTVGSIAVKNEELFSSWLTEYGADKFFLGADVKDEMIAVHGWLETTDISVFDLINKYAAKGITQVFCTDVAKDGLLKGASVDLYKKIIERFPSIELSASGGVSTVDDLTELQNIGCAGAIVGKAIYENKIALEQLISFE
jgi:phosphoribosylformimino-5-aminoimidazole carboxamide ribotide isomerase